MNEVFIMLSIVLRFYKKYKVFFLLLYFKVDIYFYIMGERFESRRIRIKNGGNRIKFMFGDFRVFSYFVRLM